MCAQRFWSINDYEKELPFYLIGVGCAYEQMPKKRTHGIPFYNWIQCEAGEGEVVLEEQTFRIDKGQGLFVLPHTRVHYYPLREPWMVDWVSFNGSQVEPFLNLAGVRSCQVIEVSNPLELQNVMRKMIAQPHGSGMAQSLRNSLLVYEFLTHFGEGILSAPAQSANKYYDKLQPVLERIEATFHEDISLDRLAGVIDVSVEYLCHLFQKGCGKRPFEYITDLRMTKSQQLLLNHHEMRIQDIARQTGYQNASYFCAVFKKHTGMSPGAYRQLYADPG